MLTTGTVIAGDTTASPAGTGDVDPLFRQLWEDSQRYRTYLHGMAQTLSVGNSYSHPMKEDAMAQKQGRRIVQVVVVDPDPNVPLEMAVLHHGKQMVTDSTDEELFFEMDIQDLLKQHNERREEAKLPPVRIRDLKREVSTVIQL
jgi:hypothetical protein